METDITHPPYMTITLIKELKSIQEGFSVLVPAGSVFLIVVVQL